MWHTAKSWRITRSSFLGLKISKWLNDAWCISSDVYVIQDENIWKAATVWREPTGEMLIGGKNGEADTHARTDWRTRSFPSFPTEGTLRGSPTCHCGSNYPAGSLHGLSPAGLHITNHITEHTHLLSMHTDAQEGTLHTHEYTYCTYSHIRTYGCMCSCAFHPQFALHRLMARTNCNDVLVQTSCSSQEKHTTLCGCECSCKHVHISLMGSAKDKYVIKGETGKKSANTHIHEKN